MTAYVSPCRPLPTPPPPTIAHCNSDEPGCLLPPEMVAAILDKLSTRDLCPIKATCRTFSQTISCLLRLRLVKLVTDTPTHELVFESSSPSQTRAPERQHVQLGTFIPQASISSPLLAQVNFTAPEPPIHRLVLDEDEQFGGVMLGLSLRGLNQAYKPQPRFNAALGRGTQALSFAVGVPQPSSPPLLEPPDDPVDPGFAASAVANRPDTPPATPPITWSVSLAEGYERLFRPWFEDPSIPSTAVDNGRPDRPTSSKRTTSQTLTPTPGSGLREARIRCVQVAPVDSGRDLYRRPQGSLSVFEYSYESLVVDVARVLVRMEEGMEQGRGEEAVVVLQWVRL